MSEVSSLNVNPAPAAGPRTDAQGSSRLPPLRTTAIAFLLLLCGGAPLACHRIVALAPCSSDNNACTGLDITNVRFEALAQPAPFKDSHSLWLRKSDQLAIRWDSYTLHLHPNGGNCDVDECSMIPACNQSVFTNDPVMLPVVEASNGFVTNGSPQAITLSGGLPIVYRSGCRSYQSTAGYQAPFFTPSFSGAYDIHTPVVVQPDGILNSIKLFVVDSSMTQTARYQMSPYQFVDASYPAIKWFTWATGGNAVWDDNFSNNLQVINIRILKGRPTPDPNNGLVARDGLTEVRPSSVVLSPAFNSSNSVIGQNHLRCYADSSANGNLDLTNCRGSATSATPSYLKAQPADKLTWIAEFNPNETQTQGVTAPPLDPGEVLVIEFTIQTS